MATLFCVTGFVLAFLDGAAFASFGGAIYGYVVYLFIQGDRSDFRTKFHKKGLSPSFSEKLAFYFSKERIRIRKDAVLTYFKPGPGTIATSLFGQPFFALFCAVFLNGTYILFVGALNALLPEVADLWFFVTSPAVTLVGWVSPVIGQISSHPAAPSYADRIDVMQNAYAFCILISFGFLALAVTTYRLTMEQYFRLFFCQGGIKKILTSFATVPITILVIWLFAFNFVGVSSETAHRQMNIDKSHMSLLLVGSVMPGGVVFFGYGAFVITFFAPIGAYKSFKKNESGK